ncbi:hypothetical protein FFLO_05295 [Filobasidium floriforme]|uniref:Peptidase M3A/M3B catalytic domain-containing protein n=1 Tax=Filobasidium floriforme TaxID=5210 RepID=A0A8K0JH25_9TREE|nr:hypothetical protein FFLO_05295 [Filobasidium floriforme]
MQRSTNFTFNGSISLETYCIQWRDNFKQLEKDLELLKLAKDIPTASNWGVHFDSLNSQVFEGIYTGEVFKNVHPDKDFQNEGATANDAFQNLSSRIEKDPVLAALVQQMTFVDPAVDPHEQRFAERWQSIFKDSGAILPAIERKQLLEIDRHLANLRTQFSSNIINAQRKWQVPLSDLEGMPDDFLKSHPADEGGHVTLTTQYMDFCRTLTYCKTDKVRQKIWSEYCARCPGRLTLKGLDNVNQFIDEAIAIAKPCALQEKKVRAQVYGANNLKVWQSDYAKEILSQHHAGFDSSQIRPYLRVGNVLPQIVLLIQELFGVQFHHRPDVKAWTETGLHPRENKLDHACVDVVRKSYGKGNLPEVVLLANVPEGNDSLLTFNEVSTLYHELCALSHRYGHVIHALCASTSVYGQLNNLTVERDFVEAPPEILRRLAINKDGQVIPDDLIKKLCNSVHGDEVMFASEQISFAKAKDMIDGRYPGSPLDDWKDVLQDNHAFGYEEGDLFLASFPHLGQAGYGPKYYCYVYALAIRDEFFEAFKAAPGGLLDKEMSRRYRRIILEPGSSRDAFEMITEFLGRPFTIDAFKARISKKIDVGTP